MRSNFNFSFSIFFEEIQYNTRNILCIGWKSEEVETYITPKLYIYRKQSCEIIEGMNFKVLEHIIYR